MRLAPKARHLIAECLMAGGLTASVKNGPSKAWPSAETVSENGNLREAWERSAESIGFQLEAESVPTGLGMDLYRVSSVHFPDAGALAAFLGPEWASRTTELTGFVLELPEIRSPDVLRSLLSMEVDDIRILRALCDWRRGMVPDALAELMLREISVPGMGTKWMEQNAGQVVAVFARAGWIVSETGTLAERLGLDSPDRSEVRVRIHDEDAASHGLWPRFSVPSTVFRTFPFPPQKVLIIENKTTFLRVSPVLGSIIIWGSGKAIVAMADRMDWLRAVPDLVYWGDCDGAGYLILDRLRAVLPRLRSVNMTLVDISAHLGKAIPEGQVEAVTADMPRLTAAEAEARNHMHHKGLRLEQEFVPAQGIFAKP